MAIQRDACVRRYLLGLLSLCLEVARQPKLLLPFLRNLALVPATIEKLERRRAA